MSSIIEASTRRQQAESQINKNKSLIASFKKALTGKNEDKTQSDAYYNEQIGLMEKENELLSEYITSGEYLKS